VKIVARIEFTATYLYFALDAGWMRPSRIELADSNEYVHPLKIGVILVTMAVPKRG
jgi:hypothetical protein